MPEDHPPPTDDTAPERHATVSDAQVGNDARTSKTGSRTPNTLFNALIGAVVTVGTAFFVPVSPALGGAVAGYLEWSDADNGLRVGALSGVFAMVPLVVIVPFALFAFVFDAIVAVSIIFVVAVAVGFVLLYTVGFGALGGVLGSYLYKEFSERRSLSRPWQSDALPVAPPSRNEPLR